MSREKRSTKFSSCVMAYLAVGCRPLALFTDSLHVFKLSGSSTALSPAALLESSLLAATHMRHADPD